MDEYIKREDAIDAVLFALVGTGYQSRAIDAIRDVPTADVAPRAEVFEAVDKFRNDLIDKFIDLCRGNDFNKLTLLKIGDTVDQIYDKQIKDILRDEDERR